MRTWIAAALLASAAITAPAIAQDHDHGGDRGQQGGGDHGGGRPGGGGGGDHRGGQPGGPQGGGQPPHGPQQGPQHFQPAPQQQWHGNGGGNFAPRPQGAQQQAPAPNGGPGGWQGRPAFRPQPNGVGNVQADRQSGGRPGPGGQPGQPDQLHFGDRGPDRGQGGGQHFSGRPDNGVNVWRNQGQPGGDPRFAGRPGDDPRFDREPGRDGHGGGRPGGWNGNPGGPGGWDRGWRQDRRYDWQDWRAQHRDVFRVGRYHPPYGAGWGYRQFGVGYRLPSLFFAEQYWIDNPDYYRLPPAYGEYRWVRYYNDALLIDLDDGEVVDAIPNFFYY